MEFMLKIELGNDAMQSAEDVAEGLRTVADYLESTGGWDHNDAGHVRDANGNTVGGWVICEEDE
jgi:hypothetical protein